MATIIYLEKLPQLVMEKITSFLDHKQLLALEQASTKLKCAVDDHFSITEHLIIGPLPEIERNDKVTDNDKKCLDGLCKIIKRCGIRLRTIQITTTYQFPAGTISIENYSRYCKHFLASVEVSNNCPKIENILASPNMDIITMLDHNMFPQQNVLLDIDYAAIYANNIKLSTGGTCKLRSIKLSDRRETDDADHSYQRIVDLFSNLEQISFSNADENVYNLLPQLMENGLKDLSIVGTIDLRTVKKYCNIWKELRALRLYLTVLNVDDIAALNKLQLPENVELKIEIHNVDDCFARLNENVCKSIVQCLVNGLADYSLMSKLQNVHEFNIETLEELQLITEGSFPQLKRIRSNHIFCCNFQFKTEACGLGIFLPQLFLSKGNQLTHIEIRYVCHRSMSLVWKALKHCTAAKSIRFRWVEVFSRLTVTYEDVEAIYHLPNLQEFIFSILQGPVEDIDLFHELFVRAEKEHTNLRLHNGLLKRSGCCPKVQLSLYKIDF